MARPSRFQVISHNNLIVTDYLKKQSQTLFSSVDLRKIFSDKRKEWAIPKKTTFDEFLECIILNNIITKVNIPLHSSGQTKYALSGSSIYEIALGINKDAYFSHSTAMYIQDLIITESKAIYINAEQRKKAFKKDSKLIQENIDRAFSNPMRETKQIAQVNDVVIYMLNGKNLNRLGVENINFKGKKVTVTGLERTLIDIAVRPNYAGGVNEVLKAYSIAKGKLDVPKLVSMIKKMDYIYPYHQTIGFYMESSGYKDYEIALLKEFNIQYNFYLTYQMVDKVYSDKWKIFYPKDFAIYYQRLL